MDPAYYQRDGIEIYNGDSMDVLLFLDTPVDLVLTDPPYGIGFDYGTGYNDAARGYIDFLWPIVEAAERLITDGYVAVYQAAKHAHQWAAWFPRDWRLFALPKLFGQIFPTDVQWRTDYVLCWKVGGRRRRLREEGIARDFFVSSDTCRPRGDNALGHPCPRPLDATMYLIECLSAPGALVLDPFAGGGTTLLAAKKLGRRAIGIDIQESFCAVAARRLDAEVQLPFCAPEQMQI